MVDKSKKAKKGTISEEDVSVLLQSQFLFNFSIFLFRVFPIRYSMNTVLGLLQEVEQAGGEKIDWREVAKNSATGISNAREYQMLWRHIAYGETLTSQVDDNAEPVDDDSDLDHELDAFPAVGREASGEAAACVKVLIASGYPNNSNLPNNSTIEAPLTINVPCSKAVSASSDGSLLPNTIHGKNVSIPVPVQKQQLSSGVIGEKRPHNEVSEVNLPNRRRRRAWTLEEDTKLAASVQKHGERNWANIARWDFKNDRRASELSQRWSSLRKKQGNTKAGPSSQPSETQLAATHRALSMALDMPMGDNLKSAAHLNAAGIKIQHQPPKASASPADQQFQRAGPSKPQMLTNRPTTNMPSERESMVKAVAVAAGARLATPADASSLIEAARSQNVVHITTGGGSSVMKPSTTSIGHQLPSNVHFIRNGLAKAPISTFSAPKPSMPETREAKTAQSQPAKPAASAVPNPVAAVPVSNTTSLKENTEASTPSTKLPANADDGVVSTSDNEKKEPESQPAAASGNESEVGNNPPSSSGDPLKENTEGERPSNNTSEPISRATDGGIPLPSSEVENDGKTGTSDQKTSKETAENPSSNGKSEDLPGKSADGSAI